MSESKKSFVSCSPSLGLNFVIREISLLQSESTKVVWLQTIIGGFRLNRGMQDGAKEPNPRSKQTSKQTSASLSLLYLNPLEYQPSSPILKTSLAYQRGKARAMLTPSV